jgi:hypothetical protein
MKKGEKIIRKKSGSFIIYVMIIDYVRIIAAAEAGEVFLDNPLIKLKMKNGGGALRAYLLTPSASSTPRLF